jgi:nucleoside-diphosphate-sugar epimerase
LKALITGGTGFLGSHIVDELIDNNYEVRVLARRTSNTSRLQKMKGVELVVGDITKPETLTKGVQDVDVIFNNAAIMEDWGSWSKFKPVNVDGTRNVLEVARKQDISRIAHTSSTAVYGFPNTKEAITEESPKQPFGNYQKSKWVAEQIVSEYVIDYEMDIASVRPPFVLGSRDQYTTPLFVNSIQSGEMVIIGNGSQIQSVVHARDAAQCLRLTAETPNIRGEAFNVASFDVNVKEFYSKWAEMLAVESSFRRIPYRLVYVLGAISGLWGSFRRKKESPFLTTFRAKLMGTNYLIDSTKAKERLGYQPRFNMDKTIRDSLQWYFSHHPEKSIPPPLQR